ncbi:MAG: AAA family ATPase [Flavobacteriales bacterium]|nr:AAA family ATPase [Flavobacteriales bacterium]
MSLPKNAIQYLKSCFEQDNRGNLITNIYSSKITDRKFLKDGIFFNSWSELLLLDTEYAIGILKDLQIHITEKELKVGLFFVNYESLVLGKISKNVCPLFLFEAEIINDEFYFLKLKEDTFEINPAALKIFEEKYGEQTLGIKISIEELVKISEGLDEGVILQIKQIFDHFSESIDTRELQSYPKFINQKKLKEIGEHLAIRSAACMFIQEKTKNTQSILNELQSLLAPDIQYSRLLLNYLNQSFEKRDFNYYPGRSIKVPAILSESQTKILEDVCHNQCMVVTGPPGTGKSFTIAAAAINEALNGKSVLIVTGSDHANNAIEDKIKEDFKLSNISARISKNRSYKSELNRNLKKWLEGIGLKRENQQTLKHFEKEIKSLENKIAKIEDQLQEVTDDEIKLGKLIYDNKRGLVNKIKTFFLKNSLSRIELHPELIQDFTKGLSDLVSHRQEYIHSAQRSIIRESIKENRGDFLLFREALNTKTSGTVKELFAKIDFEILTNVFPIWISTVNDIGTGLPLQKEMFDVVIVDEASQIDMSTILPIFQRAKKAIVCGDTEQLSPVTFLSGTKQEDLAFKAGDKTLAKKFNYCHESFLDVCHRYVKDQTQLFFLDEHYRSLPDIISFSNSHFYNNELRIMTQLPQNAEKKGLILEFCEGIRTSEGINHKEAEKCIGIIQKIIQAEPLPIDNSSIGVLSPFRKQIDYIEKLIRDTFELKYIQRHKISCGTAHTFQGNERDIMIISTVVDDVAHHGTFLHVNKSDVFNVSITRARQRQYVLHSLTRNCKFKDQLLYEYLFEFTDNIPQVKIETEDDLSLYSVTEWLKEHFLVQDIQIDYVIAGINIDIWAKINDRHFGFDAVGFPGNFEAAININKLKILSRLGIKVIPISVSNFVYHKDELKSVISRNLA